MVPTAINPTCLSQGFPNLEMNPINNINGCLQLKDLGHFLCHLLEPRAYSETPQDSETAHSPEFRFSHEKCCSSPMFFLSFPSWISWAAHPDVLLGTSQEGWTIILGYVWKAQLLWNIREQSQCCSENSPCRIPRSWAEIWTGRTWATRVNSCLAELNTHRAPTRTDKLSKTCIKNDRRRENKKSQQKSIRLSSLSKHQGTDNGEAGT